MQESFPRLHYFNSWVPQIFKNYAQPNRPPGMALTPSQSDDYLFFYLASQCFFCYDIWIVFVSKEFCLDLC